MVVVRAVRGLVRCPSAGCGLIAKDFAFRGRSAANTLRNYRDHDPGRSAARTIRTKRAGNGPARSQGARKSQRHWRVNCRIHMIIGLVELPSGQSGRTGRTGTARRQERSKPTALYPRLSSIHYRASRQRARRRARRRASPHARNVSGTRPSTRPHAPRTRPERAPNPPANAPAAPRTRPERAPNPPVNAPGAPPRTHPKRRDPLNVTK